MSALSQKATRRPRPLFLPSEATKCGKPGWLERITSHPGSPMSPARERVSLVSSPEILHPDMSKTFKKYEQGAEVNASPKSAFDGRQEVLQSWFTRDLATATHFQKQVSDHWLPECGLCCSEPETYDIHRIKLPPRISSRQGDRPQFSLSDIKEGQDLSPLPVEVETLLISAFSSPRRVSSFSLTNSTSSCAPSSSASLRCKRAKPIVPPPPLNTDRPTSSTRFRKAPSTPLTSTPASPFRALLLRPIQPYLPYIAEEARFVTLVVGGQRYTTTLATISRRPSKLAEFLKGLLTPMVPEERSGGTKEPCDLVSSRRLFSFSSMPSPDDVPGQHLQPTIVEPDAAELPLSSHATTFCVEGEVPTSISEEDWSGEYKISPMPGTTFNHLLQARSSLDQSESSVPPSLSAGSTTASSDGEEQEVGLRAQSGMEHLSSLLPSEVEVTGHADIRPADQALEIFLDRDPSHYRAILTWLRCGRLPRQYDITSTLELFEEQDLAGASDMCCATYIPTPQVALLLHPLLSTLQDLRDEAQWIGLKDLCEACDDRISELAAWLRKRSRVSGSSQSSDMPPPTARPFAKRRPKQARFYGSAPSLPLPEATPEEHRHNWI